MSAWGWRVPFALGAVIGLTVFYLRRRMDESDDFLEHQRELAEIKAGRRPRTRLGMTAIIREYPRGFAIAFGVAIGGGVVFYTYTGYLERYLVSVRGFDKDDVSLMSFAALTVFLVIQPVAGWLADRIGARRVMRIFAVGTMVTTPVIFVVVAHTSSLVVAFARPDRRPRLPRLLRRRRGHPVRRPVPDQGPGAGDGHGPLAGQRDLRWHDRDARPGPQGVRPRGGLPLVRRRDRWGILLALAFVPSVARVVPRVDVRRVDAQQLGHLLDQDGQDQRVEVGAGLAAVLDRPAEEHQPRSAGHRCRAPARTAAPSPPPSRPGSAARPRRRTRPGRGGRTTALEVGDDLEGELVEPFPPAWAAPARPGVGAGSPGPACRGRAGRASCRCVTAASLRPRARREVGSGVSLTRRCSRTACGRPAVEHPDLRLRRPDGRPRPARDLRRAARLRPVRAHSERLSAPRGWDVLRLAPDPRAGARPPTTCSPWPTPSVRPARPVPVAAAPRVPEPGREVARRGHLRMLTTD